MSRRCLPLVVWQAALLFGCTHAVPPPPEAVLPVPSDAQLAWHRMEMNAFVHFTVNTFTDREWGTGAEQEEVFNPLELDAGQWARVFRETGFRGVILTCKHHDGFCLWPSEYTEHDIANSPYKNGTGDIVGELAAASRREGLKFGVYVSPWDRNHTEYGRPAYLEYYRKQLPELFTKYGPVFEMWFDGANGGDGYYGGANETRRIDGSTYYDWPATLDMVRQMEPDVIFFSDAGPGVRWVGNERGVAGETNWNMITPDTLYAGKPGITGLLNEGSEEGTAWIPAEVDVSIRPGWFYHAREDSLVKSPERLFDIYLTSVGRGSTLLLNVPPDQRGLIHENDIAALKGWRLLMDDAFATDLARDAATTASAWRAESSAYSGSMATDGDPETYWATDDGVTTGSLEIDLQKPSRIKYIVIQEYIALGQRVKRFSVDLWHEDGWVKVAEGTTIGYKRILRIEPSTATRIRLNIGAARACPVISNVGVY